MANSPGEALPCLYYMKQEASEVAPSHGQTDLQKGLCGSCQEEEGTNLRGRARESTSQEAMGVQTPSEAPLTLLYTLPPWLLTTEGPMPSSVTRLTTGGPHRAPLAQRLPHHSFLGEREGPEDT